MTTPGLAGAGRSFLGRAVLAEREDGRDVVVQARADDAPALEGVQGTCFPDLSEDEIATARHFLSHQAHFPEGQLAVLDTDMGALVASSSDLRLNVDFAYYAHPYLEETGDNLFTTHDPRGHLTETAYGLVYGAMPEPTQAQFEEWIVAVLTYLQSLGFTAATDPAVDPPCTPRTAPWTPRAACPSA